MKMKLSKNQDLLIQHTVETQRATGRPAEFLIGQHKTQTFESLLKRGILKGKRGLRDGGGHYHRDHYEVEMTTAGWDHIYRARLTVK
jgi:hypothetical protein